MKKLALTLVLSLGLSLATGCASSTYRGQVYRSGDLSFRMGPLPDHWRRLQTSNARLSFERRDRTSLILVNGRCKRDREDVPLQALTQHLFLQFTEREITLEETVPFDGREARHTVLEAKLDGVPRAFDVWVAKKNGCVYDFILVTPPGDFEASAGEFRTFVAGFSSDIRHE